MQNGDAYQPNISRPGRISPVRISPGRISPGRISPVRISPVRSAHHRSTFRPCETLSGSADNCHCHESNFPAVQQQSQAPPLHRNPGRSGIQQSCGGLFVDLFTGRRHDVAGHVVTTFRTDHMRRQAFAALGADRQTSRSQTVVGPAAAGSGIGLFSFWNSHRKSPSMKIPGGSFQVSVRSPHESGKDQVADSNQFPVVFNGNSILSSRNLQESRLLTPFPHLKLRSSRDGLAGKPD